MVDLAGLAEHLSAVADAAALEIPCGGRVYRVPAPDTELGARCTALWAIRNPQTPDELARYRELLGDGSLADLTLGAGLVARMVADKVPGVVINEAAVVALISHALGPRAAQRYVDHQKDAGGQGKARTVARKKSARPSPKKSGTGTASGRKTPTRDSGPADTASPNT